MLKVIYDCSDCGDMGEVDDLLNLDGKCPVCGNHHGNIQYGSGLNKDQFVECLSQMSESEISKYAQVIKFIAEDIIENNL